MVPQLKDRQGEATALDGTDARRRSGPASDWITGTVVYEQNRHDAMTIRDTATATNYHVVDYASPDLCEAMGRLGTRQTAVIRLSRSGHRANVWRIEAMSASSE
jgi:hypothetical protein